MKAIKYLFIATITLMTLAIAAILCTSCSNPTEPAPPQYEGTWTGTVDGQALIIEMNGPPQYATLVYYEDDGSGWFKVINDGTYLFALNYLGTIEYKYEITGATMTGAFRIETTDIDTTVQATFTRSK